jgi:hypothetical protein
MGGTQAHEESATTEAPTPAKTVIGWRELVDFPEWGIRGVVAKIDTGARTSSLHVEDLEEVTPGRVRFHVVLSRGETPERVEAEADLVRISKVRPSTGKRQRRRVVHAVVLLGGKAKEIEVSLVSRKHMLCRMLVGRRALGDDFVVDPQQRYLFGRPKKVKRRRRKVEPEGERDNR